MNVTCGKFDESLKVWWKWPVGRGFVTVPPPCLDRTASCGGRAWTRCGALSASWGGCSPGRRGWGRSRVKRTNFAKDRIKNLNIMEEKKKEKAHLAQTRVNVSALLLQIQGWTVTEEVDTIKWNLRKLRLKSIFFLYKIIPYKSRMCTMLQSKPIRRTTIESMATRRTTIDPRQLRI